MEPITYTYATAAQATGLSVDTIKRAVKAGDLAANQPVIESRAIASVLIPAEELRRWALGKTA